MATAALSYEEPGIVTILIQSSFLLSLNVVNWILDNAIYCGLLGQVCVGIAWGLPGANWLSHDVQGSIMQLGYLGLILVVFEGGLSTSIRALWSNLYISGLVALIGISAPIGFSFILQKLLDATSVQAFAAGAALCSTSLGTTFTILSTSGLDKSRLGVILSSAAMLDDVAGLVMVQVISNLGTAVESFSVVTVIRPVFVSIAFAVVVPSMCHFIVQPMTKYTLNTSSQGKGAIGTWVTTPAAAFIAYTLLLLALVTGSSYAGTSNLFAAYIAGAVINWWDALVANILEKNHDEKTTRTALSQSSAGRGITGQSVESDQDQPHECHIQHKTVVPVEEQHIKLSGIAIYNRFYAPAVNLILKPFFFASIGFSIPITQMFHGTIFWRGMVYTLLMISGKLICGLVLVRFGNLPQLKLLPKLLRKRTETAAKHCGSEKPTVNSPTSDAAMDDGDLQPATTTANTSRKRTTSNISKPQSLYPAAMLGSAMVARGEIGFLISSLAESTGVFGTGSQATGGSSEIFLVATWAILLCTVIGPVSVGIMVKRVRRLQKLEREKQTGKPDPLGIWGVM